MSALRHGFFLRGFMLCDRCVLNATCEAYVPGGDCGVERRSFDSVVSELMSQYGLSGVVDEILAERAAMNLIRLARAEAHEARSGGFNGSAAWSKYVSGLDNMLRVYLRELALTRASRQASSRSDVLTDIDDVLSFVVRKRQVSRCARRYSPFRSLLRDWVVERRRLSAGV